MEAVDKEISLSGTGPIYTAGVSGLTSTGTLTASIEAGKVEDAAGNPNEASSSNDNAINISGIGNTNWFSPGGYESGATFNNPQNAYLSDNVYANANPGDLRTVIYKDFNILDNIPVGGTIKGIELSVEGVCSPAYGARVYLSWNGGAAYTAYKFVSLSTAEQTVIAGSSSDTWGRNWYYTDFSNANFRVRLESFAAYTLYLDCLKVKVYYTLDTDGPTVTIEQQSPGQDDPTTTLPVYYTVTFDEPVYGFEPEDIHLEIGGVEAVDKEISLSGTGPIYTAGVSGLTSTGTLTASIEAGKVEDAAGNPNEASSSNDNAINISGIGNTNWFSPGGYESGATFNNPQNAYLSDNVYANANPGDLRTVIYKDFNILDNIPVGGTIKGIELSVEGVCSPAYGARVYLSWNGGVAYTAYKFVSLSTAEQTVIAGSSSDTWGRNWYYTDFSNANFRVRLESFAAYTLYLDCLKVKVYYTLDTDGPTVTIEQQSPGQDDPTTTLPVYYTVTFDEPVYGFEPEDIHLEIGGVEAVDKEISLSGTGPIYTAGVSGLTSTGTLTASIEAGKVEDAAGNPNEASSSNDNAINISGIGNTNWFSPGGYESGATFNNPQNAYLSDNVYANANPGDLRTVIYKDFNILDNIPVGGTIKGIELSVEGVCSPAYGARVYLSWNGGAAYTAYKFVSLSTAEQTVIAGSSSDTWGRNWYYTDFSNANFRVRLESFAAYTLYLDCLKVKVYYTLDTDGPTVTIEQQSPGQDDPTTTLPVYYTVTFSEPVYGFEPEDISFSEGEGMAGGNKTVVISGTGPIYTIAVSGVTAGGTLIPGMAAGMVEDAAGNPNEASTSTDNSVTLSNIDSVGWLPPTSYSIPSGYSAFQNPQNAYLSDNLYATASTYNSAIDYRDFNISDILPAGAIINGIEVSVEGYASGKVFYIYLSSDGGINYTAAKNTGDMGTVHDRTAIVGSNIDLWGRSWSFNDFSDANFRIRVVASSYYLYLDCLKVKVYYTLDTDGPTVTIEQQSPGQDDPTTTLPVYYTVTFSEPVYGFEPEDISFSEGEGMAGGNKTVVISGTGPIYTIAVSGVTAGGTLIPGMAAGMVEDAAGNPNEASTSTDNSVTLSNIDSVGWLPPTSYSIPSGYSAFQNPQNAYLSDNLYATGSYPAAAAYQDFNISDALPVEAIINGIEVSVEGHWSYGSYGVNTALSSDGGITYTTSKNIGSLSYPDGTATAGSNSDLWGRSWHYTDFSNANFRVRVFPLDSGYPFYLDCLKVKVYYIGYSYSTTSYSYDTLGNLKRVKDAKGNITTMTYDKLGRKIGMTDPDMGVWSYEYDKNGNLISQTDAKDQTINMAYDALNRLVSKTYPVGSGMNNINYRYDEGVNGLGRKTGMNDYISNPESPEIYDYSYAYDARGRLTEEDKNIDSADYTTSYTYDGLDRAVDITYPTGEVVTNTYNDRGLPDTVTGTSAGNVVTNTLYNSLGNIFQIDMGSPNILTTTYGYYGTGGVNDVPGGYYGRLWEIKAINSDEETVQDIQYTWDAAGNLLQRHNLVSTDTETFGYDYLDRLLSASSNSETILT